MLLMHNNGLSSYLGGSSSRPPEDTRRNALAAEFKLPWTASSAAAAAAAAAAERYWAEHAASRTHHHHSQPDLHRSASRHLNWASVASWFMRPETRSSASNPAQENLLAPTVCTSIRCTVPGCSCECFTPGKLHIRYCETCSHGWVPHALDKLGFRQLIGQSAVEPVQLNVAFDIASLVLYGCQALPIRLKILLDRLFSVLQRDEVVQVLRGFGWTQEDYARGYILQEPHGAVLDRWNICSPEEEPLVLQQFLRFGETRAITQQLLLHGVGDSRILPRMEADIKRLLERTSLPTNTRKEDDRRSNSMKSSISPALHGAAPSLRVPPTAPISPQQHHQQPVPPPPPPLPPHKSSHPPPPPSISFKLPPTGLTCTPATSASSSPPTSSSLSISPLNRLQNMQPFDFRKLSGKASPERRRTSEETSPSSLMNLSVTSSSTVHLPPPPIPTAPAVFTGHRSPSTDYYLNTGSSEMGSEDDDDDEENSQSALNLSRDSPGHTKQRLSHNRKNTTPVKRQWGSAGLPLNLGTQLINPATGKKRVQCNVCLKTFCDKGALKIHFSAVHLREMHKCTVEGCNMMFSSRRSRNRHSANPNPKLHSPHLRRKISPHDGRSAQNHPILIPPLPAALNPLTFGTFPLLTHPPDLRHQTAALDLKQSLDLTANKQDMRRSGSESAEHMDEYMLDDDDEDGIVVEGGEDYDGDSDNHNGDKQEDEPSSKRYKMSESDGDGDEDMISNMDSNDDSLSVVDSQSVKEENGAENLVTKSSRKRKNQNPTRCAVSHNVNINETIISDDDSCNNIVFHSQNVVGKETPDVKCHDMSIKKNEPEIENNNTIQKKDSSIENKFTSESIEMNKEKVNSIDVIDLRRNQDSKNELAENLKVESTNSSSPNVKEEKTELLEDEVKEENKKRPSSRNGDSNKSEESMDSSNALRQLESLSQGHFGEMKQQESYSSFLGSGDPPSPARSNASSGSSNDSQSDDPEHHVYGHFQDGTFITTNEVPIDKDNPRMCTACGKVFQNHFGVKTHYQNVHLKLMHKCTVDGCNAAFPSKRSRDRHSANLNLHRKLLSTSLTDKTSMFLDTATSLSSLAANPTLHTEFLARLYADSQSLGTHPHMPPPALLNGDRLAHHPPLFLHPGLGLPGFPGFPPLTNPNLSINGGRSSGSNSPTSARGSPSPKQLLYAEDDDINPDKDGLLPCRYCSLLQKDRNSLKEHYEKNHVSEMHRCTVSGCPLIFVSTKNRNKHAEDETLHQSKSRSS